MTTEPEQLLNSPEQSFLRGLVDKAFTFLTSEVRFPNTGGNKVELSPSQITGNLEGDYQQEIATLKARVEELLNGDTDVHAVSNLSPSSPIAPDIPISPVVSNDPKVAFLELYDRNPREAARYLQKNWANYSIIPMFGE
jgi:hypothetical protein